jgi:hypothetical protein
MAVSCEARDDDAALLAATRSDPEAFARFYDRYERAITGFFLRRTSTPEAAADLTAAVFTDKAIRRGVFTSAGDLIRAIDAYLDQTNQNPQPFVWTATTEQILEKVRHGRVALNAIAN